jgi:hypothetical protein
MGQQVFAFVEHLQPRIVARASLADGYQLPSSTLFTNATPSLNDQGHMAMGLSLIDGVEISGVWTYGHGGKTIPYFRKNDAYKIGQIYLDQQGGFCFSVKNETQLVSFVQAKLTKTGYQFKELLDDENLWNYAGFKNIICKNDKVFFKAKDFRNQYGLFVYDFKTVKNIDLENNRRQNKPKSYLFSMAVSDQGYLAYKARLGERGEVGESRPDVIILANEVSKNIVAYDKNYQQNSPWITLRNSVSVNDLQEVAFVAQHENGKHSLVVSDGKKTRVYATEGKEVQEISYFSPSINNKSHVAFRGINKFGKHAVFMADGKSVKEVITQNQVIHSDKEEAFKIFYGPHVPFGGSISLNNKDEILLNSGLSDLSGKKDRGKAVIFIPSK